MNGIFEMLYAYIAAVAAWFNFCSETQTTQDFIVTLIQS